MNELREKVALAIHTATTQIPEKTPHDCDYAAADAAIRLCSFEFEIGRAVDCEICGRRKAPRGRSVAAAMANSLCDSECEGYYQDPKPGDLWPLRF